MGIAAVVHALAAGTRIVLLREVFDIVRDAADGDRGVGSALAPTLLLIVTALVSGSGRFAEWSLSDRAGFEYVHQWRLLLYRHALDRGAGRHPGSALLRLTGDLGGLRNWVSRGLLQGGAATIVVLTSTAVVAWMNPALAGAMVVSSTLGVVISVRIGRRSRTRAAEVGRHRARLADRTAEQLDGWTVPVAFGRIDGEVARVERLSGRLRDASIGLSRDSALARGVAETTSGIAAAAVALVGVLEVSHGRATPSEVVTAVLVSRQLTSPLRRIVHAPPARSRAARSRRRAGRVLIELEAAGRRSLGAVRQPAAVRCRSVELQGRLQGVDLDVAPGAKIAIVGPNGVGKTSLLRVLAGLENPDSGSVEIDGVEPALSGRASLVGDDVPLMSGSIRRNVTYGRRGAEDAEVTGALAELGLRDWSPDRVIGTGGQGLSAGERRRIELTRALFAGPGLLILDEPFTALDGEGREFVRRAIGASGATVVVAGTSHVDVWGADEVFLMSSGRLYSSLPGSGAWRREAETDLVELMC
ncbi:MAG: ATP-binding cassette domain-containing protein [Acidimicrobiales bacterium]